MECLVKLLRPHWLTNVAPRLPHVLGQLWLEVHLANFFALLSLTEAALHGCSVTTPVRITFVPEQVCLTPSCLANAYFSTWEVGVDLLMTTLVLWEIAQDWLTLVIHFFLVVRFHYGCMSILLDFSAWSIMLVFFLTFLTILSFSVCRLYRIYDGPSYLPGFGVLKNLVFLWGAFSS